MIVQDKSACMSVYTLVKALFFRENLNRDKKLNTTVSIYSSSPLPELSSSSLQLTYLGVPVSIPPSEEWYENILEVHKKDPKSDCVIVTHGGSGRSVAHLACLLQESVPKWLSRNTEMSARDDLATAISNKFIPRPPLNVVAFGVPVNRQEEISRFLRKQMQLNNVRLFTDDFMTVSPKDPRIKNACAILVNPSSSGSALKDPVSYICTEGGDEDILVHLSKFVHTQTSPDAAQKYTSSQIKFLKHALNFSQAKLVLYTTCSLLCVENSDVVNTAMKDFHQEYLDHKTKIFSEILTDKYIRSYRDIGLELVNLNQVLDTYDKTYFNGPFLEMPPSSASSGCFIALIRRKEIIINIDRNSNKSSPQTPSQEGELNSEEPFAINVLQGSSGNFDAAFLTRAALQNSLSLLRSTVGSTTSSVRSSRSAGTSSSRSKKRSMTKKAILQRVTIPTHASLAKQTRKWTVENRDGNASVGGSRGSRGSCDHNHTCKSAPHEHVCICPVCARHAKKFPELRPKS
jgi:16S rRNA C967 or C1407 C5-methylase (RsmB/RsmF family)